MYYDILDKDNDEDIRLSIYSYLPETTKITREEYNNKVVYTIKTDVDNEHYYQLILAIDPKADRFFNKVMFVNRLSSITKEIVDYKYIDRRVLHILDNEEFLSNLCELLSKYFKKIDSNSFSSLWFKAYDDVKKYCDKLPKNDIVSISTHCYDEYRFFISLNYRELPCVYHSQLEVIATNGSIRLTCDYSYYFFLKIKNKDCIDEIAYIRTLSDEVIAIIPRIINKMLTDRKRYSNIFTSAIEAHKRESMSMDAYIKEFNNN